MSAPLTLKAGDHITVGFDPGSSDKTCIVILINGEIVYTGLPDKIRRNVIDSTCERVDETPLLLPQPTRDT